jgi:uncharacterized protein
MNQKWEAHHLDVVTFAKMQGRFEATRPLLNWERLVTEIHGVTDAVIAWTAHGQWRVGPDLNGQAWLRLEAQCVLPLQCQRCLGGVHVPIVVDRWFRFESDEAIAAAMDEDAQEDVLAISMDFDVWELMEDELLMALPMVPKHDTCPSALPTHAQSQEFVASMADKANPFAALASWGKKID